MGTGSAGLGSASSGSWKSRVSISTMDISIYVVTWNMNGKVSLDDLASLVIEEKDQCFDFYVVGLQEAPHANRFGSALHKILGHGYTLLAASILQSLQLFIFSRKAHHRYITETSYLALQRDFTGLKVDKISGRGLGGMVGRKKGAVAVTFTFMDTSFLFISCHLPPHENKVEDRNYEYQRISTRIFSKKRRKKRFPTLLCGLLSKKKDYAKRTNSFSFDSCEVVVWLGDLNYRIEGSRRSVSLLIDQNRQNSLRASDQLWREADRGEIFNGFCEGPLSFPPTYKYDIGSDIYDSSGKERVPSWTDRILYKIKDSSHIHAKLEDYDMIDSIKVSDHRPVKAVLHLGIIHPQNHHHHHHHHHPHLKMVSSMIGCLHPSHSGTNPQDHQHQ